MLIAAMCMTSAITFAQEIIRVSTEKTDLVMKVSPKSAVMQAHNSCCAAYGVNFSDNLYYLFRQLHLSFPTTSSVFCDCILRIILWYHTLACISIPSSFCSSTRLVSELVGSKAPNTTLSAMLIMYLFLAKALCLELRGRWEREILAYKEFIFVTMQKYE